jgi:hypothetical protein
MTLYKLGLEDISQVSPTSFAEHGILERQHLQRALRAAVHVVAPDTMVLTEESESGSAARDASICSRSTKTRISS